MRIIVPNIILTLLSVGDRDQMCHDVLAFLIQGTDCHVLHDKVEENVGTTAVPSPPPPPSLNITTTAETFLLTQCQIYTAGLTGGCRVSLCWQFCCGCPISKPRPVLDFLSKNQGSFFFYFLEKSKSELVRPKTMFLAIVAKI